MNKKDIIILIIVALGLHLIWENAQAPLFAGYQSFSQHFPMCFIGTIGDVAITLSVLIFMWLLKKDRPQTVTDFIALAVLGFIIAVLIEQHALLFNKWDYAIKMPIIPWLKVGLIPIAQMTLLLPLSFYLTGLFNKPKYYEQ